jgi:hypothetical protein
MRGAQLVVVDGQGPHGRQDGPATHAFNGAADQPSQEPLTRRRALARRLRDRAALRELIER